MLSVKQVGIEFQFFESLLWFKLELKYVGCYREIDTLSTNHHRDHQVMQLARISLTLSLSLSIRPYHPLLLASFPKNILGPQKDLL